MASAQLRVEDATRPHPNDVELFDLSAPRQTGARRLLESWRKRRPDGALDPATALGAVGAAGLAGRLMVLEPIHEGDDWRFRVVGDDLIRRLGFDPTWTTIRAIHPGEDGALLASRYCEIAACRRAAITRVRQRLADGEVLVSEDVVGAVEPADGGVPWIVVGRFYADD
jgi:hypothetical protein